MEQLVQEILHLPAVNERLLKLRDDISASIQSHGLRASGKTQRSMVVQQSGDTIGLYTTRPFFQSLETGSRGWTGYTGVHCTFKEFKEIIRQWARDKGLNFANDDKTLGAITYTIIHHGTKTYRQGGRNDIYSQLLVECFFDLSDIMQRKFGDIVTESMLRFTQPI